VVLGGAFTALAIFNFGPLAAYIYETSLLSRNYYWQAAIKMMMNSPILGVGLDGYGDQYYRFRSLEAVRFNQNISTDTAHNVLLDIGSSGGFPLLFFYLSLIILTMTSALKMFRRSKQFNVALVSLFSGWVAFQVQSLVSINQIGIGVWGWILSGLIIGYEINSRKTQEFESRTKVPVEKGIVSELKPRQILSMFIAFAVGFGVSLPPYVAANRFYKVLQSGNFKLLADSSFIKPNDRTRYFYSAQILVENKKEQQGIEILRRATILYPDYFELWRLWATIPTAAATDVANAKAELKRLYPYNPDL
jgi:hypothetical protein